MNLDEYHEKIRKIKEEIEEYINNNELTDNDYQICTNKRCLKKYPKKYFLNYLDKPAKTCLLCRERGKLYDNKTIRKQSKEEWNNNNKDKIILYYTNCRQRKMNKEGEEYWKHNAEIMNEWRKNNPEKVEEINKKKRENIIYHYKSYVMTSKNKGIDFNLTQNEFISIVQQKCYYCDEIDNDKNFNGIDKKYCDKGYNLDNCVSCCKMCNMIKGCLSPSIFINRIIHILSINKMINKKIINYRLFINSNSSNYTSYLNRANKKKLDFDLTKEEFEKIKSANCYICNKKNKEKHKNGIDRYDNKKGYTYENVRSCCSECNYMKKEYNSEELFTQFKKIYEKYKNNIPIVNDIDNNYKKIKIFHLTNKISKDDILHNYLEKLQNQKLNTLNKYNDDEYKKNKASMYN